MWLEPWHAKAAQASWLKVSSSLHKHPCVGDLEMRDVSRPTPLKNVRCLLDVQKGLCLESEGFHDEKQNQKPVMIMTFTL